MLNKSYIKRLLDKDTTLSPEKQQKIYNILSKKLGNVDKIRSSQYKSRACCKPDPLVISIEKYVAHQDIA